MVKWSIDPFNLVTIIEVNLKKEYPERITCATKKVVSFLEWLGSPLNKVDQLWILPLVK